MIDRLRTRAALDGWRGSPAVDLDALAAVVVAVSEAIAGRTDLAEIDLNPVRVGPEGALTVDALLVETPPFESPLLEPPSTSISAPAFKGLALGSRSSHGLATALKKV